MPFHFQITLTEEDYLAFNLYHALDSAQGKKQIRKVHLLFLLVMIALSALVLLILDHDTFGICYACAIAVFTVVYLLLFKRFVRHNIRSQIKQLKKTGKLPFDEAAQLEFDAEQIVERTPFKQVQQRYDHLERVCILPGRYIFLYYSSVGAYILPIPQICTQTNLDTFLRFLHEKCKNFEYVS